MPTLAFIVAFTIFHFFLFCNVFRVPRKPELIWSALFLLNAGIGFGILGAPIWLVAFIQLPVTVHLIWRAIQLPTYHGIFSRTLNPNNIDAYLRGELS